MSAGLRYKWQGSVISFLTGYQADTTTDKAITAITKANPAVVTSTAHGLASGDAVRIMHVVGMTEVNTNVYIVNVLTANTFQLLGVDSSAYGAYVSDGLIEVGTFSNFCELTNYNRQGGSSPEIDATTVCSVATEYEIGLPNFGTTAIDFNFAPITSSVQAALHALHATGDITAIKVTLPKSGGTFVQKGFVQQENETAGNNGIWKASATIRNTDTRYDFAAA